MKETGEIKDPIPDAAAFLGVLLLDGTIKPFEEMLLAIMAVKKSGYKVLYVPPMHKFPLSHIDGIELRFAETLQDVVESFSGQLQLNVSAQGKTSYTTDLLKEAWERFSCFSFKQARLG